MCHMFGFNFLQLKLFFYSRCTVFQLTKDDRMFQSESAQQEWFSFDRPKYVLSFNLLNSSA